MKKHNPNLDITYFDEQAVEQHEVPEGFTITYDEDIVDISHVEAQIKALNREQHIESIQALGRLVGASIQRRMHYARTNLGSLAVKLGHEAREDFGR